MGRFLCKEGAFHHIVHNLHCYLRLGSLDCIYVGVSVSDIRIDAVCHISEQRPETLQLSYCGCVYTV